MSPLIAEAIAQPTAWMNCVARLPRDGEEAGALVRVHHRQLAALERVALVGHQLADHARPSARRRAPAAGPAGGRSGKHMSPCSSASAWRGADRLLAEALHVERDLLLALRDQHAGVEDARLAASRAGRGAAARGSTLRVPRADGACPRRRARGPARRPGRRCRPARRRPAGRRTSPARRQVQVGEVGLAAGPAGGLGHVQTQRFVLAHGHHPSRSIVSGVGARLRGPRR